MTKFRAALKLAGLALPGLLSLTLAPSIARADVGDVFGFGSRTAGVSGAGMNAWGFDGFGAYANPASVALKYEGKKLLLSYGLIYMEPSFKEINDVVVENDYVSDDTRTDDVDMDYRATFGQAIGGSIPLFPGFMNTSLGFMSFFPINQFAFLDTGEPFVPEYGLHRSRTQRPQVHLALGARPNERVHLGVGAQLAFSLTSDAFVFLNTTEGKPSTMRFTASIKPKIVPYLGFLYASGGGERQSPLSEAYDAGDWTLGVVGRFEASYNNVIDLHSSARAFGDFAALDFAFEANAVAYYDPYQIEVGGSYQLTRDVRILAQAEFQAWNLYKKPTIEINEPEIINCDDTDTDCPGEATPIEISPSSNPGFDFRNIIVPRAGAEIGLGGTKKLRLGYAYIPSILDSLPTGKGNFVDPSRHSISAGLGLLLSDFLGLGPAYNVDLHASVQLLDNERVEKTSGLEDGTAGSKIGSPGYDTGGIVYGGGASLSLAF